MNKVTKTKIAIAWTTGFLTAIAMDAVAAVLIMLFLGQIHSVYNSVPALGFGVLFVGIVGLRILVDRFRRDE